MQLNRLKETLDSQRRQEVLKCEEKIAELENTIANQRTNIDTLTAEVARLHQLDQTRVALQAAAVHATVLEVRDELNKQQDVLHASWAVEQRRIQADCAAQMEELRRQNEVK